MHNIYLYILVSGLVSYLIRVIPLTIFRKPITNTFIKSFLYYVPYVTLAVMTFPAILQDATTPLAGALALIAGIWLSYKEHSLITVSVAWCAIVLLCTIFIK